MRILVACEFSGIVRDAFLKRGHYAKSCDLLPSNNLGPHLCMDAMDAIRFTHWDMIILHPPCTAMALCGNRHYGLGKPKHSQRIAAWKWTKALWEATLSVCDKVVLEQPKTTLGSVIGRCTQRIQPYHFGCMEQKDTWLWIRGLPPLMPTNDVYDAMMKLPRKDRERIHFMSPSKDRGHLRSITYQGIADAMASQWG